MKQILVYADSLSWGIIPGTRQRLPFHQRWPGVMEEHLLEQGKSVRVLENCLNGRRTMWDDPLLPGRNGLQGIGQVIEMHSPLSLLILMLGSNDIQSMHTHQAADAAQGITAIIDAIRKAPIEPGMPLPQILLLSPPPIQKPKDSMAAKFRGAETKCPGLADAYKKVATAMDCAYLCTGDIITASPVDGVHLDKGQHFTLGKAIADNVSSL